MTLPGTGGPALDGGPEKALEALTLPAVVAHLAATAGDREVLVTAEGRATYAQFAAEVAQLAGWLVAQGLVPGDRLAVLFPNGLRWMVASFAGLRAGCTIVPVNTWYGPDDLASALDRADVQMALVGEEPVFGKDFAALLEEAAAGTGRLPLGVHRWAATDRGLPAAAGAAPLAASQADAEGTAFILFTSGSTSLPKGVMLPHRSVVLSGYAIGERQGFVTGDRMWLPNPLFFSKGCVNALPAALTHGVAILLQDRFEPLESLELMSTERCTIYYGGSIHARRMVEHPTFGRFDLSSLRIGTGGATPPEKALMMDRLPLPGMSSVYGLTEGCGYSCVTEPGDPRPVRMQTQGRVIDSQELRIAEEDRVLAAGETGEIQLRGAILSSYIDADVTAQAFTADSWFKTNDLGWLDGDDRLHFVGRKGEMLKSKGINVSPAQVEGLIREVDGVREVYVYGCSDEVAGEIVCAVVVPTDESLVDGSDADAAARGVALAASVAASLRARTASYNVPEEIEVVAFEDLPLTLSGKVNRRLIRERAEARRASPPAR